MGCLETGEEIRTACLACSPWSSVLDMHHLKSVPSTVLGRKRKGQVCFQHKETEAQRCEIISQDPTAWEYLAKPPPPFLFQNRKEITQSQVSYRVGKKQLVGASGSKLNGTLWDGGRLIYANLILSKP